MSDDNNRGKRLFRKEEFIYCIVLLILGLIFLHPDLLIRLIEYLADMTLNGF